MHSYKQSIIIKFDDEASAGVLNFEPKHLEMDMPEGAKNYIADSERPKVQFNPEQPTPGLSPAFKIDDLISKSTGIQNDEKKKLEKIIEDRVIDKIKDIQEKAYQEAYELGLQEGKKLAFENHNDAIKNDLNEIHSLVESVLTMKKHILDQNEGLFVDLLYFMCEKIVGEHVERVDTTIKEVLKQVLDSLETKENISVRLNDYDFETVKKLMKEINHESDVYKKIKFYPTAEIEKGGCIIETDHGLVDATLKERLHKLWGVLEENKPGSVSGKP